MTDDDFILQKQHVRRFDGWIICENDGFKLRKGRPRIFRDIFGYDFRQES